MRRCREGSLNTLTYAHHLEKPDHAVDLSRTTHKNAIVEMMRWLAGDEELNDYDEYVPYLLPNRPAPQQKITSTGA
jgi:hypothetical protein